MGLRSKDQDMCTCGHVRDAHQHFRAGTECSICGAGTCPKFTLAGGPLGWLRRMFSRG